MSDTPGDNENILDFGLEKPKNLPADVSNAYYELYAYVEKTFSQTAPAVRRVIFSLAYTEYSRKKKALCHDFLRDDNLSNSIRKAHLLASGPAHYKDYCIKAFNVTKITLRDAQIAALSENINGILHQSAKTKFLHELYVHIATYATIAAIGGALFAVKQYVLPVFSFVIGKFIDIIGKTIGNLL